MNEQNKDVQQQGTRESNKAVPAAAPSFSWKRVLGKKWVSPAVFMAAAAIILTLMWVYQGSGTNTSSQETNQTVSQNVSKPVGDGAVAVSAQAETMQWPVKDKNDVSVSIPFYDDNASDDVKAKAVVQYDDNKFAPHLGIDMARKDDKDFDVMAALSGKVTLVEKNVMVGDQVEITHPDGMVTVYQSLKDVKVTKGQEVKKGDIIAKAGRNELEKSEGTHLHFEVRQNSDGPSVNPEQYLSAMDGSASSKTGSTAAKATDEKAAKSTDGTAANTAGTTDAKSAATDTQATDTKATDSKSTTSSTGTAATSAGVKSGDDTAADVPDNKK